MSMASWFDVILCLGLLGLAWGNASQKGRFHLPISVGKEISEA